MALSGKEVTMVSNGGSKAPRNANVGRLILSPSLSIPQPGEAVWSLPNLSTKSGGTTRAGKRSSNNSTWIGGNHPSSAGTRTCVRACAPSANDCDDSPLAIRAHTHAPVEGAHADADTAIGRAPGLSIFRCPYGNTRTHLRTHARTHAHWHNGRRGEEWGRW